MSDREFIKKMLRSVLQSSKTGVPLNTLQSQYQSLCGENIPLKKMGYSKLEDYLQSIPSVVYLECRMGQVMCFAAVSQETAYITELVAKQRSSHKSGRSQVVNCKMRFKPTNPNMLNVLPGSSLRQPSANRPRSQGSHRGCSASGDYRQTDQRLSSITPLEHRKPASQPASQPAVKQRVLPDRNEKAFANSLKPREKPPEPVSKPNQSKTCTYDVKLMQSRVTQLLDKYCSGLWMSKLSGLYRDMFNQQLHPQVLVDLVKWTHICTIEKPFTTSRDDRLIYPPLPSKPSTVFRSNITPPTPPTDSSTVITPISSRPSTPEQPSTPHPSFPGHKPRGLSQKTAPKPRITQPPAAYSAKQLSSVTLRSPAHNPDLAPVLPPCVNLAVRANGGGEENHNVPTSPNHNQKSQPSWTFPASTSASPQASSLQPGPDILPLLKATFYLASNSAPSPHLESSAVGVSAEVRQRIKELLSKYSCGLWAHALPKLFMDAYKMPFPEHILDNLSLLEDICTIEYPIPQNKRAILYKQATREATASQDRQQCRSHSPTGLEVLSSVVPPRLVLPSEQYPSVLVTDAKSSNAVTIRYVGENYSNAQEAMEDAMLSFYSHRSMNRPLANPVVGQLVAVRGEDGDELARAQLIEVMAFNKAKVYYVDYGIFVETSRTNLLELHQDFLSLPFQAINVRLAGLEAFSSHPLVLSSLEKLAVRKILLMETLQPCQQNEVPTAVLYDTSQDDDININSTCLKALQDETMSSPLTVNATYQDVCVTNVCADGIIYCQLPSRGAARLSKLLKETEAIFTSQMTSESLVSRPISGKFYLARHKGKWSRVEIINMYGNRVMEILFLDLGVTATVEVTDLREIPPLLLKDFTIIPPQAIKCRLVDVKVPEGGLNSEAVLWVKEALLGSQDCRIKILKLDRQKGDLLVYIYLFLGTDGQDLDKSINHQLTQSVLWQKLTNNNTITSSVDAGLSALLNKLTLSSSDPNPVVKASTWHLHGTGDSSVLDAATKTVAQPLPLPPPLELPQPGQNMDVFVPVACHPGYFVLQPWQDLHKLVVLMGEMILYYNQTWKTNTTTQIQKGDVYAAKINKNWHRVQVKGILANGLVSVYELDHGKHELIRNTMFQPLIEEFRQLPFQAITAQLAGMPKHQWSEEASMLFRNHVEDRALVAQVESVQEASEVKGELWEPRLTVYLVDTTVEERDIWIHTIMADIGGELSSAA